jgi:hypothetical protein
MKGYERDLGPRDLMAEICKGTFSWVVIGAMAMHVD